MTTVSPGSTTTGSPSRSMRAEPASTVQTCSTSNQCSGPAAPGTISTCQSATPAPPRVGEANVVVVALGVLLRRASARRMTGTGSLLKMDNVVVDIEIVNLVVCHVN